ncbi:MAG: hypothetical protein DRH93_00920, partial [Deltaproteobacteria bacterium]
MHKDQDVLSLIRELDEQFIKTNHLPLDKPDYQKIKQTPFWTINLCFDILVNLKDASMVYERLESMKNDFFVKNTNIDLSFINTIIHLKYGHEKASELKKLIVEMMQDYMLSKQDAGESYLPDETSKQKTKQDLKKIENKIKKLHEKFNDEYPKIDQALQYVFICLRDVQDLFKSKNFIDVEIEGTPGKCKPFKFIKWAKENGYKIPHMLEVSDRRQSRRLDCEPLKAVIKP